MVQVYEQLRSKFTVDDYGHYLFTPRELTRWVMGLLRYDLTGGSSDGSSKHVLEVWAYEAHCLFRDRIVGQDSLRTFDNILLSVMRAEWDSSALDGLEGTAD